MDSALSSLIRRIEEAAFSAWPALQHIVYDGWLLRFSNGYTKRANSVNGLYEGTIDTEEKIDYSERIYASHGLPPVFRLTPLASPSDLDDMLAARGYKRIDPTLVQYLPCDVETCDQNQYRIIDTPLDEWMALFVRCSGSDISDHGTHRTMLASIPSRHLLASLESNGLQVACGIGVQETDFLGLFDLVTDRSYRSQGHGTKLVEEILHWGRVHGARHAYLQVMESNTAARRLYEKLGFTTLYRYWYRVPTDWPDA